MKEVLPGWLMVEVPPKTKGEWFFIHNGHLYTDERFSSIWYKRLPKGSYEIVGVVSEVSEEVAAGVVRSFEMSSGDKMYADYTKDYLQGYSWFRNAVNSLTSLARSNGFEPERTLLIRKLE